MRLVGQYTFEIMRKAFQGLFGFRRIGKDYILDLFQLQVRIIPHVMVIIYIRDNDTYTEIGTFDLH